MNVSVFVNCFHLTELFPLQFEDLFFYCH